MIFLSVHALGARAQSWHPDTRDKPPVGHARNASLEESRQRVTW
jgi:hypothetical protein